MASSPIYTSLNVPTVITSPSVNCFQWSEDGQAIFTSKSAVYIMTPEHGINFDVNSVLKSSVDEDTEDRPSLGWFRTMIAFDKNDSCRWTDYSQDWSATSLGSMDISVWAMTLSPSHITPDAGCVLAVLSSNMDLSLWIAGKNALKGEWKKISNVTTIILESFLKNQSLSRTANTIAAQILCIDWSSQPNFTLSPALELDSSFLVCGTRAGNLLFLRYTDGNEDKIRLEQTLAVTDQWILQVAFSKWRLIQPMTCITLLAYSIPDGSVGFVRVKQTLQETAKNSPFGLPFTISTEFEQLETKVSDMRRGALTALKWIDLPGRSPVLVYTRPGTIHFWSNPSLSFFTSASASTSGSPPTWSGLHSLRLKTQKRSIGSSFLQPISGMQYILDRDALVLCLVDGSFHVVYGIAGIAHPEPILDYSLSPDITMGSIDQDTMNVTGTTTRIVSREIDPSLGSDPLSTSARGVFTRVERTTGVTFADVMRTSGMVCYDEVLGSIMWLHEASRPADLSYKHDAKHNSVLVVTKLWDSASDDNVLKTLVKVLGNSQVGPTPLSYLRPILFHLRRRSTLIRLHPRLIEILRITEREAVGSEHGDHTMGIYLDVSSGQGRMQALVDIDFSVREELRNSLKRHLFGYDQMLSLRMRLSLADFAWKLSDTRRQADYGVVAQTLLIGISYRNLRTLIRHLTAIASALTLDDIPFVLRLVIQSSLPDAPGNLSIEGRRLEEMAKQIVPIHEHDSHLKESCPACGVEVPLQNIINATCQNGHTWSRCSVTTFILSTAHVRTCIGCTRKAFLPLSSLEGEGRRNFLPSAVRKSWFVEELLEAVHRCLFCGNAFVSVL
ncbi:putative zinc-finger of transcription factor IIIC complex-domain-containing protein [Lentinula aciculospora]|uniref:Zinc-finger of transcription factor IIIC complex-domain-containing protein n=1 Tax=Lentinula aciculospora TaxID=153920 RepID=A0A9W9DL92_9AGAR|nr:putative zinc-finger of transcription factor IIIC complex-domain-containing protein [Lentinula aciculospora]